MHLGSTLILSRLSDRVTTYSVTAMENFSEKVKMMPKIQMPGSEALLTAVNN